MATTLAYIALPVLATYSGVPYLGVEMSMGFSAYAASYFAWNAYSLYQEQTHENHCIESAVAYRDFFKMMADSPLVPIYDFASIVKSYDRQIGALKKQNIQEDTCIEETLSQPEHAVCFEETEKTLLLDTSWDSVTLNNSCGFWE